MERKDSAKASHINLVLFILRRFNSGGGCEGNGTEYTALLREYSSQCDLPAVVALSLIRRATEMQGERKRETVEWRVERRYRERKENGESEGEKEQEEKKENQESARERERARASEKARSKLAVPCAYSNPLSQQVGMVTILTSHKQLLARAIDKQRHWFPFTSSHNRPVCVCVCLSVGL